MKKYSSDTALKLVFYERQLSKKSRKIDIVHFETNIGTCLQLKPSNEIYENNIVCIFWNARSGIYPEYMIHCKDPDYKRIECMLPRAGSVQLPSVLGYVGYVVEKKRPSLSSCCSCCSRIEIPRGFNTELEQLLFDKGKFDGGLQTIVFSKQSQVPQ